MRGSKMVQFFSILLAAIGQLVALIRERVVARRAADAAAVNGYARIEARIAAAHAAARAAAVAHGQGGGDEDLDGDFRRRDDA